MRDLPREEPSEDRFDVSIGAVSGDCVVVSVRGDVDIYTAAAFRRALEDARATGAGTVVIDLAAVGFMDSTGFGQLVSLVSTPGGPARVAAANCRPIVRNALRLMGLDHVLTVHPYGTPAPWTGVRDTAV